MRRGRGVLLQVPAKKTSAEAPRSMITSNEDLLGSGKSGFKPFRRQIEHRDEEMKEVLRRCRVTTCPA